MMVVGLTGGVGSGKTTVAKFFNDLGVPTYIADKEAKLLMTSSKEIKLKIRKLFGDEAYRNGKLNRAYLSTEIFRNKELLGQMNGIVHPAVAKHFKLWLRDQTSPYVVKEAAIIFEQGKQNEYDYIITVIANREERIQRVMGRDMRTRDSVVKIIANQFSDSEKSKQSDFIIKNNSLDNTREQVIKLHGKLLKIAQDFP